MKLRRRTFLHMAASAAALPVLPRTAWALDYPTRPVRVIVGFPAGSGPDVIARLVGQRTGDRLGQQFFVENRSGAGSSLAAQDVVAAPADGYTLAPRRQRQCRQRQPLSEPAFQFRARHRGRRHDLQRAFPADGQSGSAGENFRGVHRLRESQSGQDQYGVAGYRHHAPPHVRALEDDDGHRTGSRAISDGLHTRSPERAGASRVFNDNPGDAVRRGRQIARAGREQRSAVGCLA